MAGLRHTLRAPAGAPWATLLLFAACLVTSLPLYARPDLYSVIGAGDETHDNPHLALWHFVTTTFVHGGGFPGLTAHLVINGALLLVLGGLLERALGTGRFFALSGTCLVVSVVVKIALDRPAHGISAVVWSYVDFAPVLLAFAFRSERARALLDPVTLVVLLLALLGVLGLVNPWHVLAVLVGAPFAIAWRGTLRENLERMARREPPEVWRGVSRSIGVVIPAALLVGMTLVVVAALAGWLGSAAPFAPPAYSSRAGRVAP